MKKVLEKLKAGKSAGLDGLRAELYKELINDRRAIEKLKGARGKTGTNRMEEIKNNHDTKKEQTNRNRTETNSID